MEHTKITTSVTACGSENLRVYQSLKNLNIYFLDEDLIIDYADMVISTTPLSIQLWL